MRVLVALLCLSACVSAAPLKERQFSFEYRAAVPAEVKGDVRLWIPVPHDDANQHISNLQIESSAPYKMSSDSRGNRMLLIESDAHPTITMRFDCVRKEHVQAMLKTGHPEPLSAADKARWLAPDRLVPLDDTIRKWAKDVVDAAHAHTDLEMARAIYNHVVSTVKYDKTGKGWGRGDIYYACDARRGNCTDFHAIFIGYARAMGIPARFSIGVPIPSERGSGTIAGYHCWAEFYAQGIGWVPVDASEAAKNPSEREYYFGAHDENRVEFTQGRDLELQPKQAGPPLNFFIYPYAEADGKPVADIERKFTWKDLPRATASGAAGVN